MIAARNKDCGKAAGGGEVLPSGRHARPLTSQSLLEWEKTAK
jgi:hypothetical protein